MLVTAPAPAAAPPEPAPSLARPLRFALLASLVIPLLVLTFFDYAPRWLDHQLHAYFAARLRASPQLSPAEKAARLQAVADTDFAALAYSVSTDPLPMRRTLDQYGFTAHFHRLRWGYRCTLAVTLLVLGVAVVTLGLDRLARRSPANLIRSYRLAWRLGMAAAVAQLVLLGPLLVYALFEAMVIYDNTYSLKVVLIYSAIAAVAMWKAAAALLRSVPLEFSEPMSRTVTPADAPELWEAVREVARCLGTEPPDHVVIGMRMNFYVTELDVIHSAGRASGRTLFLSQPLLKHLTTYEVLAVIGHELAHFLGDDTRLTREFYPLHRKAMLTMHALTEGGPGAWTSVQSLNFFTTCFAATTSAHSRERELLADRASAEITSPEIVARALVKFQVVNEAFSLGFAAAVRDGAPNPYNLLLEPIIRDRLLPEEEFWGELMEKHLPHPLDSHPDLQTRLAALGRPIGPADARALVAESGPSAYDEWFTQRSGLFTAIRREAETAVGTARTRQLVRQADATTDEGRTLLEKHLPEQRFQPSMRNIRAMLALLIVGTAFLLICGAVVAPKSLIVAAFFGACALGLAYTGLAIWQRHRWAELVLTADGLDHDSWAQPLPFSAVESMHLTHHYGLSAIVFKLRERRPPPWRFALFRLPRRSFTLNLCFIDENPRDLANTLYRYFIREYSAD